MSNSTLRPPGRKSHPRKPRKDFPLYAHRAGYWAKKVLGRTRYFGKVADDPKGQAALKKWLDQKDALLDGREPRAKSDGLSVADLCNAFLTHKGDLRDNGEISPRTFRGYYDTCAGVVKAFGRSRVIVDLAPADFASLRAKLAKTRKAVSLRNEMQRVRSIFKFAFDEELILNPARFGASFGKPKLKQVRREAGAHKAKHGRRMFEANEIRRILANAKPSLKAMVLLAANGGLGQTDISCLPLTAVNLESGWLDYPRPKTGVDRRVPLWSETIVAIREWLPLRPKAKDKADSDLLFLTCKGARWVRASEKTGAPIDSVNLEFGKLLRKLELKRHRVAFYAIRHTFQTIGSQTRDEVAVSCVMGHHDKSMAARYREGIDDERLTAVTDYVRRWLFAGEGGPAPKKNSETCDPTDPCDPSLAGKGETGSQRVASGSEPNSLATVESTEKIRAGSHGAQGSQNTRKVLEDRPRLRVVG